jgi:hypothetical protein
MSTPTEAGAAQLYFWTVTIAHTQGSEASAGQTLPVFAGYIT